MHNTANDMITFSIFKIKIVYSYRLLTQKSTPHSLIPFWGNLGKLHFRAQSSVREKPLISKLTWVKRLPLVWGGPSTAQVRLINQKNVCLSVNHTGSFCRSEVKKAYAMSSTVLPYPIHMLEYLRIWLFGYRVFINEVMRVGPNPKWQVSL